MPASRSPRDAARYLWQALPGLAAQQDVHGETLHCVEIALESGEALHVYKAEPVPAALVVYRIRAFAAVDVGPRPERRALLLGTQDGRAILAIGDDLMTADRQEVVSAGPSELPMSDLQRVMGDAIRRFVKPRRGPSGSSTDD